MAKSGSLLREITNVNVNHFAVILLSNHVPGDIGRHNYSKVRESKESRQGFKA